MNEMQRIFNYNEKQVRVIEEDGEIYFVGKDICKAFGDTNHNRSLSRLDDDEKGVRILYTPGGNQEMICVNESGLYSLLFNMQPQKANDEHNEKVQERIIALKTFKRWITHEVIPTIRKTGSYNINQQPVKNQSELDIEKYKIDSIMEQIKFQKATLLKELAVEFKGYLSDVSIKGLLCESAKMLSGNYAIERPKLESKMYTANEIGKLAGVSGNKVGRVSNLNNLKNGKYGEWILDKSQYSDKQVSNFLYNEAGKNKILNLLESN